MILINFKRKTDKNTSLQEVRKGLGDKGIGCQKANGFL